MIIRAIIAGVLLGGVLVMIGLYIAQKAYLTRMGKYNLKQENQQLRGDNSVNSGTDKIARETLAENSARFFALEDDFEILYDVELDTGKYDIFSKGQVFGDVSNRLVNNNSFFDDVEKNLEVVYPEDRQGNYNVTRPGFIRGALSGADHFDRYYRLLVDGEPAWAKMRIVYKDATKKNVIVGVFNAADEMIAKGKNDRLIAGFASDYEVTLLHHLKEDCFETVSCRGTEDMKIVFSDNKSPNLVYADWYVHPDDRDYFRGDIYTAEGAKAKMKVGESFSFEYRRNMDGKYAWYRAVFTRVDEDEVLIGYKNCDEEILYRHLSEKVVADFASVFIVNINDDTYRFISRNSESGFADVSGGVYTDTIREYITRVNPAYREKWNRVCDLKKVREMLSKEDRLEYVYPLEGTEKRWRRCIIQSFETENGIPSSFIMTYFVLDDTSAENLELTSKLAEQRIQLEESLTFTNFFLDTFVSAYYVNLDDLSCQIYKRTDELEKNYPVISSYMDSLTDYIDHDVHPDDRERLLGMVRPGTMKQMLKEHREYSHIFRDISGGVEKTFRMQIIRGGEENHAAFGFIDISHEVEEQRNRLLEAEESKKLIASIAASYNVAYAVNLTDDSFRVIRSDDTLIGRNKSFEDFSGAKEYFIGMLPASDRERMRAELDYDTIRTKLAEVPSYSIECRFPVDGAMMWNELNITLIDSEYVAVGLAQKDLEITQKHLEQKRFSEYFALYEIDIDSGMLKVVKESPWYKTDRSGAALPYSESILGFARTLDEEYREYFEQLADLEYIKKELADDDKRTYAYRSNTVGDKVWVDCTSYVTLRHGDGTPAMFTLGFSIMDSMSVLRQEMQRQLNEDMQMIGGLASGYHALYYFNIDEESFKVYALDGKKLPKAASIAGKGGNPLDVFSRFANSDLIHPGDRDLFTCLTVEELRGRLAHSKKFTVRFRRNFNGVYRWTEMDVVKYEEMDERANAVAVGFADRDEDIRREQLQQKQLEDALASELARAQEEKVYQRAILNNAYSYFRINLSQNKIIPPIIEKIDGRAVDYTGKFPSPLPTYEEIIVLGAENYVDENYKESYIANQNCQYLMNCYKEGNLMPEYVCRIYSSQIGWHYRKYITYLSKDEINGEYYGMSVAYDVTEEYKAKELEEQYKAQLEEARNTADAANKSKTDFLFSMSHDIRTPMNAITGFTNMAVKHIDDREKVLDCLDKTQKAGSMLLSLINSVLEVSRIESGHATLEEQYGDVYYSFVNIEHTMQELADTKDIKLFFEFGDVTDRYVYADFSRCMRVFVNVISNAIKYTPEGGEVKVRCEQLGKAKDGRAVFRYTVTDNGIGMSEEFQKHVFDQFARENTATVSGIQGSGLGMSVVKSFVELMGGTVGVKSKKGEGTTFTIEIPFKLQEGGKYTDPVTGDVISQEGKAENTQKIDFTGKMILLVEDNELNREIAVEILEGEGFVVDEADDGTVAVDKLKENGPGYYDYILMDIQMPLMNGYEATKAIREMYPQEHIPIIALSANAFAEDKAASIAAGMDDHVAKPVNIRELMNALAKHI